MSQIRKVEFADDYTWGSGGTPTWQAFDEFLADSLEPGLEEIITYDHGDGSQGQDGVQLQGEIRVTGATLPTAGTRYWFRFTDYAGNAKVVGGAKGCHVQMGDSALRPSGGGPAFTRITFNAAGTVRGDTIEDDQTP